MEKKDFHYSLNLVLTTKCNNCCKFCYQKKAYFKNLNTKAMKIDTAKRAVQLYLNLKRSSNSKLGLGFVGGEPLLEKKLIKQVVTFTQKNSSREIEYIIFTNARLLKKYDFYFFIKNKIKLRINLLGMLSGLSKVDPLVKCVASYPYKDAVLVLNPGLADDLKKIIPLILQLKLSKIFCILEHNDKIWNTKNLEKTFNIFKKIKEDLGKEIELIIIAPLPAIKPWINSSRVCFCQKLNNCSFTVLPNADVFPCMISTIVDNKRDYETFRIGRLTKPRTLIEGMKKMYALACKFKNYNQIPCLPLRLYDKQKKLFSKLLLQECSL